MRPTGTAEELERRRRRAVGLLNMGCGIREVARRVGVAPGSVVRWRDAYEKAGTKGLDARPHPGRPARLSQKQREKLIRLLAKGPRAHGYRTELWTLGRVAEVIHRRFGVRYDPAHVWRILNALGWSCQKPERRARERDEERIARWRKQDWPRIKKSAPKRP